MPFYVLKIGGSLIDSSRALMHSLSALSAEGYSFLVVPGGGPMADLMRDLFRRHNLSQEAAHWMAVLAMEQYAYILADGCEASLTTEIRRSDGLKVLLPYQALREDDRGIEHSWDYTSDSIAAWAARRLDAPLVKATNVRGVMVDGRPAAEIQASSLLGRESCIDQGALHLLEGRSCWVLDGRRAEEFVKSLKGGRGGTVIKG
jgi:aspartokinase-like uncharacterized kinase